MAIQKFGSWEPIGDPLGEGGQSVVYLVRKPERVAQRTRSIETLKRLGGQGLHPPGDAEEFAMATMDVARRDSPDELAALKVFNKIRKDGAPAEERFKVELSVMKQGRQGLPLLIDSNESELWLVTEYFPNRTLDCYLTTWAGQPAVVLHLLRPLVIAVAELHKEKIVHRDIKPANIFINRDGGLVLGDFGIAFLPEATTRITLTGEGTGPWQFMPPWAEPDERLENPQPNFDVYSLGKVLWCITAGRPRLSREFFRRAGFNLVRMFPSKAAQMELVNSILDKCVVDSPEKCLSSAGELLNLIDDALATIDGEIPSRDEKGELTLPCYVCKKGFYQEYMKNVAFSGVNEENRPLSGHGIRFGLYVCNVCSHYAFFAPGNPKEAASRNWKPWKTG